MKAQVRVGEGEPHSRGGGGQLRRSGAAYVNKYQSRVFLFFSFSFFNRFIDRNAVDV